MKDRGFKSDVYLVNLLELSGLDFSTQIQE